MSWRCIICTEIVGIESIERYVNYKPKITNGCTEIEDLGDLNIFSVEQQIQNLKENHQLLNKNIQNLKKIMCLNNVLSPSFVCGMRLQI
jgi:hypothetical protein